MEKETGQGEIETVKRDRIGPSFRRAVDRDKAEDTIT